MSRRVFLEGAALGVAGLLGASSFAIDEAWAGAPTSGSLSDVRHVVVLMQENRSFDHYHGTMAGVRGFGDKAVRRLRGRDVFHQPHPARTDGGYLLPYRVDTTVSAGQDITDLPHDWGTTHAAVNGGTNDGWIGAKTEATMGYFTEQDVPFHRALAKAFTICDAYFCSLQGPTSPNRLYHWTGTIDPDGRAGGPVTHNPPDHQPVLTWTTYPERLQKAGVSWQVYANDEVGVSDGPDDDGHVGDYGDNPLWFFQAYHDALASDDPAVRQLAERAGLHTRWKPDSGRGKDLDHVLSQFVGDCAAGTLPAVSWVVAPYLYTEHPLARPIDGAAYVQRVLNAIWGNRELRDSTVVFLNYDENDGFYDHVVPPTAPPGTPGEHLPAVQPDFGKGLGTGPAVPIGLGPRVPMTVVSPWSRGGFVNSQVFDHTSVLRFLEVWTGVHEPNISEWRRALCGDLTSCFDFSSTLVDVPGLPDTAALRAEADATQSRLPKPTPPAVGQQQAPRQDPGSAPARPLPYQPQANVTVDGRAVLTAANTGAAALQLVLFADHLEPVGVQRVDVHPGTTADASVELVPGTGAYDVWVHGPNGFLRHTSGDAASGGVEAVALVTGEHDAPTLTLTVRNSSTAPVAVTVDGATVTVPAGGSTLRPYDPCATADGWYDITVARPDHAGWERRFAGHLENGRPSRTG